MIQQALIGVLNHLLRQSAWARRHLQPFSGRQAQFVLPPWQLALTITTEGLFQDAVGDAVDVMVTLPAASPLLLFQGVDRLMADAHVTGNAEFATALSFVLRNLRWDAEEDLSRAFGDMVATRVLGVAGSLAAWQGQAAGRLAENLAGYMGQEARLLTPAGELIAFRSDLAEMDDRLLRLTRRVAALRV